MRKDGTITVYILQHVHPNTIQRGWDGLKWDGSGDCSQFEKTKRGVSRELFKELEAGGDVWQEFGIHATYNADVATDCAVAMMKAFPDFHWRVCRFELSQSTNELFRLISNQAG